MYRMASKLISRSGLDPKDFCIIRNQCFLKPTVDGSTTNDKDGNDMTIASTSGTTSYDTEQQQDAPFWYVGQRFFQGTRAVAKELADWFEDPAFLSEWLLDQQQRMVLEQPFVSFIYYKCLMFFLAFTKFLLIYMLITFHLFLSQAVSPFASLPEDYTNNIKRSQSK